MTADQYRKERKLRGTQIQVAALLGVDRMTIVRREGDKIVISKEAELALLSLSVKREPKTKSKR